MCINDNEWLMRLVEYCENENIVIKVIINDIINNEEWK